MNLVDSLEALDRFQALIQQDTRLCSFCCSELNWIQNRKSDWTLNKIRVGVIGVTSSGKSTLINAILGSEILSTAVVPSTSQLICCSYGKRQEINVLFENGKEIKLNIFKREKLIEYSDEKSNPKNIKGVLRVDISTPRFDLGKDILLIDSPGLDAYGLESHEKLTLESLLPTIDACIYVTTMKPSSDKKTAEFLESIATHNCPLIIVQNMLDSVQPSPSNDKTSEQVALDHKNRMRKIIEQSSIDNKDSVCIVQISAINAARYRTAKIKSKIHKGKKTKLELDYEKSNYANFIQTVSQILEQQKPRIENMRLRSVIDEIRGLINLISKKLSELDNKRKSTNDFPHHQLKDKVEVCLSNYESKYEAILGRYINSCHYIKVLLERTSNDKDLDACLEETNATVRTFESDLIALMADFNNFIQSAADELKIPTRDLQCSSLLSPFNDLNLEKTEKTVRTRVKKEGAIASIERFFADLFDTDWGYEYVTSRKVVTDAETTKENIHLRLKAAGEQYRKAMKNWFELTVVNSLQRIQKELKTSEEGYNKRQQSDIDFATLREFNNELNILALEIDRNIGESYVREEASMKDTLSVKPIDVDVGIYEDALLRISKKVLYEQHQKIAFSFFQLEGCSEHDPILVTWDENCMNEFLLQTGIKDARIFMNPDELEIPPSDSKKKCVFVLVNTIQFGAVKGQIMKLHLAKQLCYDDYVVWVVEDFQQLINGYNFVEGLTQMCELTNFASIPCNNIVYILHKNPVYNLTFLELQKRPFLQKTPELLIKEIQDKYSNYITDNILENLSAMIREVHLPDYLKEGEDTDGNSS